MTTSPLRWLLHLGQGIAIGVANVIPGVSGGTMALVFGIYERLIELLSDLFRGGISLLRLDLASFRSTVGAVEWGFLVSLSVGVLIAPLIGAALIPDLLETWPQESRSLFFGLVLGTIPIPWLRISDHQLKNVLVLVAAAAVSFILVGFPPLEVTEPGLWAVFGAAMLAMCAAILPGISGAFILVILGMYLYITGLLHDIKNFDAGWNDLLSVAVFCAGCALGLIVFSKFLRWLLARHEPQTMALLCGFMFGSLRKIWPFKNEVTLGRLEELGLTADKQAELRQHPELVFELKLQLRQFENAWPDADDRVLLIAGIALAAAVFVFVLDRITRGHEHAPPLEDDPPQAND